MFIRNLLCLFICLFATNFSSFSSSSATQIPNNSYLVNSKHEIVKSNNWILEQRNNIWWWVLYDEDGIKVMEYPAGL